MCAMRGDAPALSDVPQLRALYEEAEEALDAMDGFVKVCEVHLRQCLVSGVIPSAALTRAIAVSKIRAVETSIELCFLLKQEAGLH
jgi:acyl-CoA oxidase